MRCLGPSTEQVFPPVGVRKIWSLWNDIGVKARRARPHQEADQDTVIDLLGFQCIEYDLRFVSVPVNDLWNAPFPASLVKNRRRID